MTAENFIYWLQGFMEISDPKQMNEAQIKVVKDHIALVLKKETPIRTTAPIVTTTPSLPYTLQPLKFPPDHHTGLNCQCKLCKPWNPQGPLTAVC